MAAVQGAQAGVRENGYLVDGCDTLPKLFLARCRTLGERTAHREKHLGIWKSHSWVEFLDAARAIGLGLAALGLRRGGVVSILSEDNKEWIYADLGIQCMGGIVSGIYPTDSAEQVAFLLRNSDSRFLIAENAEQLDKFLEIRDRVPEVLKCIVLDREGLHGFVDEQVMFLEDLYVIGRKAHEDDPDRFRREVEMSCPGDTAILIYTSGTTGRPKGAMISHENIICSATTALRVLPTSQGDEQLCFLPLCHVLERLVSVFVPIAAQSVVNFAESVETVFDDLREVSPASFTAVPRIWEKIHSRVSVMSREATPVGRWAYGRALTCGMARAARLLAGDRVPVWLEIQFRLWDRLVLANLRRMIGLDRARYVATGAAPISPDLVKWYWAIGLVMLEGYGQTESSGVLSVNLPRRRRLGSIGPAVPGVEMKIAPDGEILARGPLVFKGYWNDPALTAETVREGWLHTGDVGRVDDDGFFWITGRLKDIIITAGGKNISPAGIENRMKFSPYVSDAVVVGDRRRYLTALVIIDRENVERFAQENRVPFSDFASLCAARSVQELICAEVETVNAGLAPVEQVKDFRLIDILLTAEDDEMTPTMKLRRGLVEQKHEALIAQMY
ncbi:MAG: long-chain fatty acid--CoA ligase [Defluviicoccus sp.]|nr:long-chain fatty acid--CoA ligase [Defluviicoccus sp.]MDE0276775.1 long-chain fatty acid--CoA ligase [Defluviicoccus sp.]